MWGWSRYVPVAEKRANAKKQMEKLKKQGKKIQPIEIEGRLIAKKFWGKRWCDHLESFADYDNRLPRGRTYVRNGSVCHLEIAEGRVEAMVSGSSVYQVVVKVKRLPKEKWEEIKKRSGQHVGSLIDLLQGRVSEHVMEVVSDEKEGLFPNLKEIDCTCSCPDWADMCKHVAAVLYGVGSRLDFNPELLFQLRGVDPSELVCAKLNLNAETSEGQLDEKDLSDIFGLDFEEESIPVATPVKKPKIKNEKKANDLKSGPISIAKTETVKVKRAKKRPPVFDVDRLTGSNISELRAWHGLSVVEFADKLAVTPATVARWETNPNPLRLNIYSKDAIRDFMNSLS